MKTLQGRPGPLPAGAPAREPAGGRTRAPAGSVNGRRGARRAVAVAVLALLAAVGESGPATADEVDFNRDIRPILSENCFHCHGPDAATRQAGIRLDTREGLFGGGEKPPLVIAGERRASELIRRVRAESPWERMPPPDSLRELTERELDLLERWVDQGAPWQQHWSFEPPRRPPVPEVQRPDWPRNEIDHFILARLEQEGLAPSAPADRQTLLRRVTLDLTGLPPTPAELDAFLADDSPRAYERAVDRLLASPRYGERMVWEWLDAARYADSSGFQADPERTMWPWRDWVIRALNENMPFDRFTIKQLAGDLLPGATREAILATGFNRNHMYNGEGGRIPEETRVENVMDRVEATATVWLGLTLECARCHDHKYDPLSQIEYYQLYAFFNQTSEEGGIFGSGQIPPVLEAPTAAQEQDLERLDAQIQILAGRVAALEDESLRQVLEPPQPAEVNGDADRGAEPAELPEEIRSLLERRPDQRNVEGLQTLIDHFGSTHGDYADQLRRLKQRVDERRQLRGAIPRVMVMDQRPESRPTHLLQVGAYDQYGEAVEPGVPEALPPLPDDLPRNRLALAQWLVDPQHPLTARVNVNRYWQLFFGTGLVKTAGDFGIQGERPSHPELLDWLAVEFVESGWDVKALQRLIVTSATYRQSSQAAPERWQDDPENRLLARGPRLRMPSWMLRDQALASGGLLEERVGGPPVHPYQPEGIWSEATFGQKRYVQDHGEKLYRRSVYTFWRRIVGPTMLFDTASRQVCTVDPVRTNSPLHALVTLNDIAYVEAARALAQRVLRAEHEDRRRMTHAFRLVAARAPRSEELDILLARLERLKHDFAADDEAAHRLLDVGESPRDQRLDPAEHAAWSALCSLLLNLDEVLTKQ